MLCLILSLAKAEDDEHFPQPRFRRAVINHPIAAGLLIGAAVSNHHRPVYVANQPAYPTYYYDSHGVPHYHG